MIFINAYPYVDERHLKVFDYFRKKDDLVFILPKVWKAKRGKVIMEPNYTSGFRIIPVASYFTHSRYPIIRGLLKGWMPSTGAVLKKMAKKGDVLYAATEPNLFVTYLNARLAKKLGLTHLFFSWQNIHYRNRLNGWRLKLTEWLIRKNTALSHGVVCGNTKALTILNDYVPTDFRRVVVPMSGVDTDRFIPQVNSQLRKELHVEKKVVITFAGVLDQRKGVETLLNAFRLALGKTPEIHLVMVGMGPLEDFTRQFVKEYDIEQHVTFMPWLPNKQLPAVFNASDIFIYPSEPYGGWEEQFGYSMAEAMSSGLPVISTKSGSIEELVTDGKSGILVEPRNKEALHRAIIALWRDKQLRISMGQAGRKHIVENFSHKIIADKLEKFLRSV